MKAKSETLLSPRKKTLRGCVDHMLTEWGFAENLIYDGCVSAAKRIHLSKIARTDVRGPIVTFLENWGQMARVTRQLEKRWEDRLAKTIRESSKILKRFRRSRLETINPGNHKEDIRTVYEATREIVKPTSAAKTLHLLCPDFFPLWDANIRQEVSRERRKRGDTGIGSSSAGYFKFLVEIHNFLLRYDQVLSDLSRKHKKPKLRIVDAYVWEWSR